MGVRDGLGCTYYVRLLLSTYHLLFPHLQIVRRRCLLKSLLNYKKAFLYVEIRVILAQQSDPARLYPCPHNTRVSSRTLKVLALENTVI